MAKRSTEIRALTVRQPWAWALIHGGKDIEYRSRQTEHRGPPAIHAAQGMTRQEYEDFCDFYKQIRRRPKRPVPVFEDVVRSAIIGTVHVVDCVDSSRSPWFFGDYGFVVSKPKGLKKPIAMGGRLGFFRVKMRFR